MEDQSFHPYIPADRVAPEMTAVSVLLGAVLAIVFGAANAYLGLRVGMTISASIPAAVLSMGLTRFILKRDSILENNMVQTIGSAGESVAAGAIFTLPALFMWAQEGLVAEPSMLEIGLIALFGGVLGILFMIPLRRALIVKEHGVLAYPEGQACAEVLIAGEEGGTKASTVFAGLGIAAFYKFIADGFKWFPSEVHCVVAAIAGDISQDLKTGFLVGATPKKQQIGEILGVICSAIAIGSIMYLLNSAWGYGSAELPAPQAMLMKMVVEGVMLGNLPWNLVLIGVFLSLAMWILGIPVLAVAIGVYLPIHLSAPIMVGGLLRRYMESRNFADAAERTNCVQSGVLYSSGLIAGEGLIGILLAILAVMDLDLDMSKTINLGNVGGLVVFALLVATIYAACQKGRKSRP